MHKTQVKSVMTRDPVMIASECTLKDAAKKMLELDCGVLPVGENHEPQGIITDRDIVIRAVCEGKDVSHERVRDYMTEGVCYCQETDTLQQAADQMQKHQVNRLLVKDSTGKMCGILTFGSILRKTTDTEEKSDAVEHAVGSKAA